MAAHIKARGAAYSFTQHLQPAHTMFRTQTLKAPRRAPCHQASRPTKRERKALSRAELSERPRVATATATAQPIITGTIDTQILVGLLVLAANN